MNPCAGSGDPACTAQHNPSADRLPSGGVACGAPTGTAPVTIVDYAPEHRRAFQDLNEAWIIEYFRIEEADRKVLADPESTILARGGHILVAIAHGQPIGVCALINLDDTPAFELAKMGVAKAAQGRGVGRQLATAAIHWARAHGARRLFLESNTRLEPAIRLYRSLGFTEVSAATPSVYSRSNIQMELRLD
jgi:GNAT superfamily N-acetyltransferase